MSLSQPHAPEPIESLVARARGGEEEAQGALFTRYEPFVRRRLAEARRARNWFWLTDLDDAVQETFAQFFGALRGEKFRYEGEGRLEGFLVRTAWFVSMNLKDKHRGGELSLFDAEEGGLAFDLPAWAEAVYDGLERRDCLRLLAAAVAELNPSRREVVERTLLGQPVRQICAATGKTPASVSGLKFNALVELRRRLAERGFLERCGELFGLSAAQGEEE